ncbi:MAG: hypothetical protein FWD13_10045, partial [Treponema sp.]|nr:hypothetical protein [Treponema sp.]
IPSVNGAWYRGSTPGNAIPNLDENAWIDFANNGGAVPANLASNYTALQSVEGGKYVMTQDDWDEF